MSTEDLLRSSSYLNSMSPQSDDATAAPVDVAAVGAPTAHEPESGPNGAGTDADAGSVHAMTPHGQVPPPPQDSVVVDINDTDGDAKARRGTHCGDLEQAEVGGVLGGVTCSLSEHTQENTNARRTHARSSFASDPVVLVVMLVASGPVVLAVVFTGRG